MRFTIMISGGLYGLHIKAPLAALAAAFLTVLGVNVIWGALAKPFNLVYDGPTCTPVKTDRHKCFNYLYTCRFVQHPAY
jgi:hypothetical protein